MITSKTKVLPHFLETSRIELWILRGKVSIRDNIFIGLNVLIVQPVRIGNGAIVAAGAVVTMGIEEGAIAAGNPAKAIRCRIVATRMEN